MSERQTIVAKITYSREADALYLYIIPGARVAETKRFSNDVLLDFDENDRLLGMEILDFVSTDHDISGLISRYGLPSSLPEDLNGVKRLVSDSSVKRVSRELVVA